MKEQRWELYVDESGNFSCSEDEVVVAGLLVNTEQAGLDGREIAQAVQAELPHIPLPLHYSFLKRLGYSLFCYVSALDNKTTHHIRHLTPERIDAYEQALRIVSSKARKTLDEMTLKLRKGKSLNVYYNEMCSWEGMLRSCPTLKEKLEDYKDSDLATIRHCLHSLCADEQQPYVILLFSAEESLASAALPHQDRYLLLLQNLIERAWQILQIRGYNNIRLEVKIATRDVFHPQLNKKVPLSTPLLNQMVTSSLRSIFFATEPSSMSFPTLFHPPSRYDDEIPTSFFLVDYFSNSAYNALKQELKKYKQGLSLKTWEKRIQQNIGLWPLSSLPPVTRTNLQPYSHFAAGPEMAEALRLAIQASATKEAFQNKTFTQCIRLWAKEQALSWLP
jgi:hypothetical protein